MQLLVSPHDRDESARQSALRWADLPAEGDFAVISPGGEGGARILLILSPWPGEGHYPES